MAEPVGSDHSCAAAFNALVGEWNAISFQTPSKPAQSVVTGKEGHVTSGGEYNYMAGQIRQAHLDCERGDASSALHRIEAVRDTLGHTSSPNG